MNERLTDDELLNTGNRIMQRLAWLKAGDGIDLDAFSDDICKVLAATHQARAAVPAVQPQRALPNPGSAEASAMMDSLLAEYNWPANTKNAARAGWEAANRWLATTSAAVPAHLVQQPTREQAPVEADPAPPSNLPDWDDCALRVRNSEFIAKRVAEGGYGAEPDSLLATDLHRFIYEYDDALPYRSSWFRHRLELVLNEAKALAAAPQAAPAEQTPAGVKGPDHG